MFEKRVWHIPRPVPEPALLARAVEAIRAAKRPLIVAGGGVLYSEATEALAQLRCVRPAFRSARRRPAKDRCPSIIRRISARSASPARRARTSRRAKPTW